MLFAAELARVLDRSRQDKLTYLERLAPHDAVAIELIINGCIKHRWPKSPSDWFALFDQAHRLSQKLLLLGCLYLTI